MAWTPPINYPTGLLVTQTIAEQQFRDNLNWLNNRLLASLDDNTGTFTTTSATIANVNATTTFNITTSGGGLLMLASGVIKTSAFNINLYWNIDGTQRLLWSTPSTTDIFFWCPFHKSGLAAGAHTVSFQWAMSATPGTGTITKTTYPLLLSIFEV